MVETDFLLLIVCRDIKAYERSSRSSVAPFPGGRS